MLENCTKFGKKSKLGEFQHVVKPSTISPTEKNDPGRKEYNMTCIAFRGISRCCNVQRLAKCYYGSLLWFYHWAMVHKQLDISAHIC